MDLAGLAHGQALIRVAIGTGLLAFPGLFGRAWAASTASDDRAKVLSRALGARDVALGAAGLLAERDGDREWIRRSFAAQAFADAVDFAALVAAGRALPLPVRLIGGTMAAGSAAIAAAYASEIEAEQPA
jgi:hypothetical protein